MAMLQRVYTDISKDIFKCMVQRAKSEESFMDEKGMVDVGELFSHIIQAFAEGNYTIIKNSKLCEMKFIGPPEKRIYTDLSEKIYYGMLQRAKQENACVNDKGKIDIGPLLKAIITSYANGSFVILDRHVKEKVTPKYNQNGWVRP